MLWRGRRQRQTTGNELLCWDEREGTTTESDWQCRGLHLSLPRLSCRNQPSLWLLTVLCLVTGYSPRPATSPLPPPPWTLLYRECGGRSLKPFHTSLPIPSPDRQPSVFVQLCCGSLASSAESGCRYTVLCLLDLHVQ